MSKTPNQLARDYLATARRHLDALLDTTATDDTLYWAVSDIHRAVVELLAIVEATDPVLAATGEEEPEAAGPGGEEG